VQRRDALVGAWRLVSWEKRAADGQVTYPMGVDAIGYLIYMADGCCSVMISRRVALRSPVATCSAGRPRTEPGLSRASWPMRVGTPHGDSWRPSPSSRGGVPVSQLGGKRPGAVREAGRGPAHPRACLPLCLVKLVTSGLTALFASHSKRSRSIPRRIPDLTIPMSGVVMHGVEPGQPRRLPPIRAPPAPPPSVRARPH
jgi:hypothetical protein